MFGFHVILQALVPRECRRAERAENLFSELFRNMLAHVGLHVTLQKRPEFTEIAEESLHLVVHFVDVPLQLVFIVRITTQAAESSFVMFLTTSLCLDEPEAISSQLSC